MNYSLIAKEMGVKPFTVFEFRSLAGEIPMHKRTNRTKEYIDGGICVETKSCVCNFSDEIDPSRHYICPYCLAPLQVVQYKSRTDYGFRHYPGHQCTEDYVTRSGDMRSRPGTKTKHSYKSINIKTLSEEQYRGILRSFKSLKMRANVSRRLEYTKANTLFTTKYNEDFLVPNFCTCPECDNANVYIKLKTGPVTKATCNNISGHKSLGPVEFIPVNTRGISVRTAQTKSLEELNEDKLLFVIKEGYDRPQEPKHYYIVDELAPPVEKEKQEEFPLMSTIPSVDLVTEHYDNNYKLSYDYIELGGAIGLSKINWDIPDSYKLLSQLYKEREIYLKEIKNEQMER